MGGVGKTKVVHRIGTEVRQYYFAKHTAGLADSIKAT